LGLDLVKEAAARERVEALERRNVLARRQTADRGEKELVRAGGEALERRGGIRTGRQSRPKQDVSRAGRELNDAVVGREALGPARPPRAQRARETIVQLEKIPSPPTRFWGTRVQELGEARQIVFDRVDGPHRLGGRGPRQTRPGYCRRFALERLRVGNAPTK